MRTFDLAKRLERARGPRNTRNTRDLPSIAPFGRPGAPTLIRGTSSTSKDTPNRPISGAVMKSGTSQSIGPKSELALHGLEASRNRRCGVVTRVLFKSFPGFRGARSRSRFFRLRAQPWNFAPDGSHLRPLRAFPSMSHMAGARARWPTNRPIRGLLRRPPRLATLARATAHAGWRTRAERARQRSGPGVTFRASSSRPRYSRRGISMQPSEARCGFSTCTSKRT